MKKIWLAAILAVVGMVFSGCAGTSSSSTDDNDDDNNNETTTYDSLCLYLQEVSSWDSLTSDPVEITGNGSYEMVVNIADFDASAYNEGYIPLSVGDTGSKTAAFNMYFASKTSADTAWTTDDISKVSITSKVYYMADGSTEWTELSLNSGYTTTLQKETDSDSNGDETGAVIINVSLINPWATSYCDLEQDINIAKLKVVATVSGI